MPHGLLASSISLYVLFSLKVDDGGLNAVARLAHGDMRRALNLLQVRQSDGDFVVFQLFNTVLYLRSMCVCVCV